MEIVTEVVQYFDVVCSVCGKDLDGTIYKNEIIVDPCETCLENAKEE